MPTNPPSGTVTFLFTDIEGSLQVAQELRDIWETVQARHHVLLQSAMEMHGGHVFQIVGDGFCVAFDTAGEALSAAVDAQRELQAENWGETRIHVRMGINTGEARAGDDADGSRPYTGYLTLARTQRVMSAAYGGQILLSSTSADSLLGQLPAGVGLRDMKEHRLKGLVKPERLWQVVVSDLRQDFPPLASLNTVPHNLPLQLTSFVGREKEIPEVHALLRTHRLVTLTGSGGTGKTRLSLQVGERVLDEFRDGAWFIELAPLFDPALIPNTVASVLGVREEQGRPLMATLLDWLRNRQMLFILDNCEHLIEASGSFANAVLQSSRETRILTSSREPLGISGESCYRVPSLECPNPAETKQIHIGQLQDYPAVRLFVQRATEAFATFKVTNTNAAAITQICSCLDGIPLAIELAAVRVRALSAEQIAARLDDRLRLFTGGSRTALPRHKTLRDMIDWSHNLLSEPERLLLRRLSMFRGGWTLEAAEQICAGDGIESPDVLDLLSRLVDKSLVVLYEPAAEPRYRMLETIRQYAREKLLDANEGDSLRDQHLHFFLNLAEHAWPLLESARRIELLPRLESEHDNLRAALEWACERDVERARWLAGMLERFWFFGDHLSEARSWYSRVLDAGERVTVTKGLAMALVSSGCVALNLEHIDEAQASLEQSAVMWQQLGEPKWLAWSLEWLGYLLLQRGEAGRARAIYAEHEALFRATSDGVGLVWVLSSWGTAKSLVVPDDPTGKALLDEALSLARTLQDPFCFVMCYSCLGDWAVLQGDHATARRHFLDALEWRRQLGTRWIIAAGLWQVANTMRLQGDFPQAEPMYAEALALARELGDQRSEAHIAQELGVVAIHLGDVERATTLLAGSLSSFRKWADPLGIARCLLGFAVLLQTQRREAQAARVLGFVEPWLQSNGIQLVHFDHTNYVRSVAAARTDLGQEAYDRALAEGREMTLEQAVAYARGHIPA